MQSNGKFKEETWSTSKDQKNLSRNEFQNAIESSQFKAIKREKAGSLLTREHV